MEVAKLNHYKKILMDGMWIDGTVPNLGLRRPAKRQPIRLPEVQRKTGAELVYNGIVGPNLGRHLLFCSQIPPPKKRRDRHFGKANFGKANKIRLYMVTWENIQFTSDNA